ncbi:class III lanthionine synthetase LanKC N-terminal domain-containing protein [Salinicoccus sp. CNSTN-B1]
MNNYLITYHDLFKNISSKSEYDVVFDDSFIFYKSNNYDSVPLQGWKVHISSTVYNSSKIFYLVSKVLIKHNVTFKVLKNSAILEYFNSKNCPRPNFGKFITIYPRDVSQCIELLDELQVVLKDFESPYILNDLRYKNCKSLYFRYGRMKVLDSESDIERMQLTLPSGEKLDDPRLPYFYLPEEIEWPFPFNQFEEIDEDSDLLNGKYSIENVITMSSKGGVYGALEGSQECIIKEYRPFVRSVNNLTGLTVFNNERRIYEKFQGNDFVPQMLEHFQEWEHFFLVIQRIDGESLTNYLARNISFYFLEEKKEKYFKNVTSIFDQIAKIIKEFHDEDYVLGDISTENFLVDTDNKVYIIDFESVGRVYDFENNYVGTNGFYHIKEKGRKISKQKDLVAFGFLIMKMFSNSNFLINIDYRLVVKNFEFQCQKIELPNYIKKLAVILIDPNIETNISEVKEALINQNVLRIQILNSIRLLKNRVKQPQFLKGTFENILQEVHVCEVSEDEKFYQAISDNNYSVYNGALGHLLNSITNKESTIKIEEKISQMLSEMKYEDEFLIGYQIGDSQRYSYYLFDGVAGFLLVIQYLRKFEKYKNIFTNYREEYYRLLNHISLITAHKCSVSNGLSGIILVLINENEFGSNSFYLHKAKTLVEDLLSFSLLNEGKIVFPDENSSPMDDTFANGYLGILFCLTKIKQYV